MFHHFRVFSLQCWQSHCAFYYKTLWDGMKDLRMAKKGNCACAVGSLISIFVCFQDTEGNTGSFLRTLITDTKSLIFSPFFFSCRAKAFRGKKVHGEYDIKVEQVTDLA